MSNDLYELVKSRKNFYRDNYQLISTLAISVFIIIILLNLLMFYLLIAKPIPDFYATSMDGKLIQLKSLDTPNYSKTPLI